MRIWKIESDKLKAKILKLDERVKASSEENKRKFKEIFPFEFNEFYNKDSKLFMSVCPFMARPLVKFTPEEIPVGWKVYNLDKSALTVNKTTKKGKEYQKVIDSMEEISFYELADILNNKFDYSGTFTIPKYYIKKESGTIYVSLDRRIDLSKDKKYIETTISEYEKDK